MNPCEGACERVLSGGGKRGEHGAQWKELSKVRPQPETNLSLIPQGTPGHEAHLRAVPD